MCEQMLEDMSQAHGLNFAALRYFNAAGADPDGEIGEEHEPETHLIPNALKAAVGLGGPMKLFGTDYPTPDGTCIRDFVHVTDLAEAHILAADRIAAGNTTSSSISARQAQHRAGGAEGGRERNGPRRAGDDVRRAGRVMRWRSIRTPPMSRASLAGCRNFGHRYVVSTAWDFHRRVWGVDTKAAE